jgi:hypothetical protein
MRGRRPAWLAPDPGIHPRTSFQAEPGTSPWLAALPIIQDSQPPSPHPEPGDQPKAGMNKQMSDTNNHGQASPAYVIGIP